MKIRLLSALAFTLQLYATTATPAAPAAKQAAVIHTMQKRGSTWYLKLDFVEVRDCDCDGGVKVINQNNKLRAYSTTPETEVALLKDAAEHRKATMEDLAAGRTGKNQGWPFDASTPFEFRLDNSKKQILEIRQLYFP